MCYSFQVMIAASAHSLVGSLHAGKRLALSFSSSGLLLSYHAGVAMALSEASSFMDTVDCCVGTSGGAVVAALLVCAPEKLDFAAQYMLSKEWAKGMGWYDLWDPAHRLLPSFFQLHDILPLDAYEVASRKLRIHCTNRATRKNEVVCDFESNEELIGALQASCSFAWSGVKLKGDSYVDGGLSGQWLPAHPEMDTVTVSPFSGQGATICPRRCRRAVGTRYGDLSWRNFVRLWDVSVPHSSSAIGRYIENGKDDAKHFLFGLTER